MKKRKVPEKNFTIYRRIWQPKNWIVEKHEADKTTVRIKPNVFENTFLPSDAYSSSDGVNNENYF